MDVKQLLGILNKPWMMEPSAARYWQSITSNMLNGGIFAGVPSQDTRYRSTYRVDPKGAVSNSGCIQVIPVHGPITKYDTCGTPGSTSLQQATRAAAMDDTIEAILYDFDSPGGQVDGTENFANEISSCPKPTIALVNSCCCSAAYWIASACDEICVDPANAGFNAMMGSIGTMAMWQDFTKQEEMQGIKTNAVYADASCDKNKSMDPDKDGNFPGIKKQLNQLNDTFLSAVKTNRAGKLSDKENVLSGKVYNGKDAVKYGLADRLGNFQAAVSRLYFLSKNSLK